MDIVDTSVRVLAAYGSSAMRISGNTNGINRKKTQYCNTKFLVLDNGLGVLLATPGVRISGAPPAAAVRLPCSWLIALLY